MKTYNYHHSKRFRFVIIATLFVLAIVASMGIERQQKKDQTEKTYTIIHELERELSRRKRIKKDEQISFRRKQKENVSSESNNEEFYSIPEIDAQLIGEPMEKRDSTRK